MKFTNKRGDYSRGLKPLTYLVPEQADDVPLIIGYDQCLEYFKINVDTTTSTKSFLIPHEK